MTTRGWLVALVLCGCATTQVAAPAVAPTKPVESSGVFARYDGATISQAEVDAAAGDDLTALLDKVYEARAEAAEQLALESLVRRAAKKEGVTEEAWMKSRLERALPEPSEADLRALYAKVRSRLGPEATFDAVRDQLIEAAQRKDKAERARVLFSQLKSEGHFELLVVRPEKPRKQVEPTGPSRGPANAKVTMIVFADFQCPFCSRSNATVEKVIEAYPGQVRLVYRHFPLSFHAKAPKAAQAAACADEQGKFWAFHDALYADQDHIDVDDLKAAALRLGLDVGRFTSCLDSGQMAGLVERDTAAGRAAGVSGTPAYFINGISLSGARPEEEFRELIDAELKR